MLNNEIQIPDGKGRTRLFIFLNSGQKEKEWNMKKKLKATELMMTTVVRSMEWTGKKTSVN